jgi:hypothetical protein
MAGAAAQEREMIAGEVRLFLFSCLLGVGFGGVYDGFRVLRLFLPAGEKSVFLEDALFFLLVTAVNFLFFLSRTYGQLRLFLLIGEGLGFLLYYLTAGRAVYFLMLRLSRGVKRLLRSIWQVVYKIVQNSRRKTVCNDENAQNASDS